MATCPNCGGYLGERHNCAGVWRLHAGVAARIGVGALIGGIVGGVVIGVLVGVPSLASLFVTATVGGIIAHAIIRGPV